MNSTKRLLTLLVLVLAFSGVKAQVKGIGSFGLEVGWYNPSMDYWNNRGAAVAQFDGAFQLGFNVKMIAADPLFIKAGARYWKSGIIQGNETVDISLVPIYAEVGVNLNFMRFGNVTPFIAGGGAFNYIHMTFERQTTVLYADEQNGKDFTYYGSVGFNIPMTKDWFVEVSYNQVFGKYKQTLLTFAGTTQEREVKLDGPMIIMSINYVVL